MSTARALLVVLVTSAFAFAGCGSKKAGILSDEPPPPPPARSRPAASASAAVPDAGPVPISFREEDFTETEDNRDPFRSFADLFAKKAETSVRSQHEVLVDQYSVDELKLVGIVTGVTEHRAMLVDPAGKGWIVRRGHFVGKPEVVRATGPTHAEYELHWRIDRIRDADIVLVREDPSHPDVPPATRIVPLRTEEEATAKR